MLQPKCSLQDTAEKVGTHCAQWRVADALEAACYVGIAPRAVGEFATEFVADRYNVADGGSMPELDDVAVGGSFQLRDGKQVQGIVT
jgi:hypothetical protein